MESRGASRQGAIMCAVLRRQELFMVQAGEAFALVVRDFGVERLPDRQPERVTPLGVTAGLDLRYFHNWLEAGDMLLLADPRITNLPGEATKKALVDSTVEESLPKLKQIIGSDSARLLLLEFVDEALVDAPAAAQAPAATVATAAVVAPSAAVTPQRHVQRSRPGTAGASEPTPKVVAPQPTMPSRDDVSDSARRASSRAVLGLSLFTGWLADLMRRLRPPRDRAPGPQQEGWLLPALIAVIIPIFVAVIVSSVYVQRGRVQRISELKREMNEAVGLAAQSTDDGERRQLYNKVLVLAAEGICCGLMTQMCNFSARGRW